MYSLVPPRNTKTATTPDRNVVARSNQNPIVCLIKTYKSHADTPDLNPTGSAHFALKCVIFDNFSGFSKYIHYSCILSATDSIPAGSFVLCSHPDSFVVLVCHPVEKN